jgi:transposase InsO family protein
VFTIVDRTTRWAEAVPVSGTTTRHCAEAFFRGWISRFGVPELLTSDRGAQFTSEVWAALCQRLGIKRQLTTAYHPQANGLVERFHRQLKDALRARLAGVHWAEHLPWVLLGLRAAPKEDSNISSAEMLYGSPLTLPGELAGASEVTAAELVERIRSGAGPLPPLPTRLPEAAGPLSVPDVLQRATHVYILRGGVIPPLAPRYQGPYLVVQKEPKRFL